MNTQEQRQFIKQLAGNVIADILNNSDQWPKDWDGFELRQLLADKFVAKTGPMGRTRKRDYNNTIATTTI